MLGCIEIGAHQGEHPIGVGRTRGPGLLPVDQEVVALILRARAQRGEIRTGVRLGVTLAPLHFTAGDSGQVFGALLIGAELEQRRADHADTHAHQRRASTNCGHFLSQHARFGVA